MKFGHNVYDRMVEAQVNTAARHRQPLETALGVPVVEPTQAAVAMALGAVLPG